MRAYIERSFAEHVAEFAEGHGPKDTKDWLDKARTQLFDVSTGSLAQVARYSDISSAKTFAKSLVDKVYALSKEIENFIHNNQDLR